MYSSKDGRNHLGKYLLSCKAKMRTLPHRTLVDKVDNVTVSSLVNFIVQEVTYNRNIS